MTQDRSGLARIGGFFAMMLGVGLILDAHAVVVGGAVLAAAATVFGCGLWFGQQVEHRNDEGRKRKGAR